MGAQKRNAHLISAVLRNLNPNPNRNHNLQVFSAELAGGMKIEIMIKIKIKIRNTSASQNTGEPSGFVPPIPGVYSIALGAGLWTGSIFHKDSAALD